jgi:hypothetical protein
MLFNTFFNTALLLLATAASSVNAVPIVAPQELIVFNPPITSPKESAAWAKGSEQIVRWSASFAPFSFKLFASVNLKPAFQK